MYTNLRNVLLRAVEGADIYCRFGSSIVEQSGTEELTKLLHRVPVLEEFRRLNRVMYVSEDDK